MIEKLISTPAVTADAFVDLESAVAALYPEEAAAIARAVPKRQREYATVRLCARRALSVLGVPPAPLLPGHRGAPRWPGGVVGSMTHCAGYRAAAVGSAAEFLGFGIDAEPNAPLPTGLSEVIARPRERSQLAELSVAAPGVRWDRLLFSAKEAVFKTWYPLTGLELDFHQADIQIDPTSGTFFARLLGPALRIEQADLRGLSGRWLCERGLILTAITLHRPPVRHPGTGASQLG